MTLKLIYTTPKISLLLLLLLVGATAVACGSEEPVDTTPASGETPQAAINTDSDGTSTPDSETAQGYPSGYPAPGAQIAAAPGYPTRDIYENLADAPPNPEVELPAADEATGVVGGVLIREVVGEGFEPLTPRALSLAGVLLSTDGNPAFIKAGADSPKAELFPTGVFIFRLVPPGEYGLMVDVGYAEFPVRGEDGWPLLITVEPGGVIEMGQVITELPVE